MVNAQYSVGMTLPQHTLKAHNDAEASANKIHDNTVAAQYGFRGGLVPGVTVYAYMTYPLVQSFGEAWLRQGKMQVKFVKPFYEGDQVAITGTVKAVSDAELSFDMQSRNAEGIDCGVGTATLPAGAVALPDLEAVPAGPVDDSRIPVSWEAVVVGEPLPVLRLTMSQADNEAYCRMQQDDLAVYQGNHGFVHPGALLRQCNRIFSGRFILGPWIHAASEVNTYRPCRVAEPLEIRGVPIDKFDKKGHEFVVLDVLILAGKEVAQRVKHTCIFRPRKG